MNHFVAELEVKNQNEDAYAILLDLDGNIMMNLDEKGQMIGANIAYSPLINWKIEIGFTIFSGDKNNLENRFTLMEDFSNTRVGIIYNF